MPSSPGSEPEQAIAEPEAEAEPKRDLEAEIERLEDRYKRAVADLDNYRKRSERELERRATESAETLLSQWLETVDSVERALIMAEPGSPLAVGLQAVLEQMEAILERQGARRVGEPGEPFDPERHEAVGVVSDADVPDHHVVEVARSGYAIGDRVLRPAQVIVSRREGV